MIATINPATGEIVATFDALSEAQLDEKLARHQILDCAEGLQMRGVVGVGAAVVVEAVEGRAGAPYDA